MNGPTPPPGAAGGPVPPPGGAFYLPLDPAADGSERFAATEHTVGPWSLEMQHLSPPAALLVRALERCAPREGTRVVRVTVDVLGAVPRAELTVRTRVLRPGRQIELVVAELFAPAADGNERAVVRATGWRMAAVDTTGVVVQPEPPLAPVTGGTHHDAPEIWLPGYLDAIEWRWVVGFLDEQGPGAVWARPRVQVVAGEDPNPLVAAFAVIDSANGVGAPLDVRDWTFVNTDLTVHLHRAPAGPWTGIVAETSIGPDGVGTCSAVLHDELGPLGRSTQILIVRPR